MKLALQVALSVVLGCFFFSLGVYLALHGEPVLTGACFVVVSFSFIDAVHEVVWR